MFSSDQSDFNDHYRLQIMSRFIKKGSKYNKVKDHHSQQETVSMIKSDKTYSLSEDEPEVKLEVFGRTTKYIGPSLLLLTPLCAGNFQDILNQLQDLRQNYKKQSAIKLITKNQNEHNVHNISNLQTIQDEYFWSQTLPNLIDLLVKQLPLMRPDFKLLLTKSAQLLQFTRLEVLLLLASMFLGILPRQPHVECATFGQLMTFRNNDQPSKIDLRRQKLKCIITYLKTMMQNDRLFKQTIKIQRNFNKNIEILSQSKNKRPCLLRKVTVCQAGQENIENFCGKAIMVNPCKKIVGVNAAKNGNQKQDILFAIFPQLFMVKLLCQQLDHSEAIIVYRARRFSNYDGHDDSFHFVAQYPIQQKRIVDKSVIACIDASNYSKIQYDQHSRNGVTRQIQKAYVGFDGANFGADEQLPVCTGKWGCGKYGGDEDLKFLIQWIAASLAKRDMIYVAERKKLTEYQLLSQEITKEVKALDLVSLIMEYAQVKSRRRSSSISILDFLKYYV